MAICAQAVGVKSKVFVAVRIFPHEKQCGKKQTAAPKRTAVCEF
jgi:hypothetical protein